MPRILTSDELKEFGHVPQSKRSEIYAKIDETFSFFEKQFDMRFRRPVVLFDLKGHTAGYANYRDNTIRLNTDLVATHYDQILNQIVPHEVCHLICHAIDPKAKSHGWKWQTLMQALGLKPNRCHTLETRAARIKSRPYHYRCDCQDHWLTLTLHRRICAGQYRRCKNCGVRIVEVEDDR